MAFRRTLVEFVTDAVVEDDIGDDRFRIHPAPSSRDTRSGFSGSSRGASLAGVEPATGGGPSVPAGAGVGDRGRSDSGSSGLSAPVFVTNEQARVLDCASETEASPVVRLGAVGP